MVSAFPQKAPDHPDAPLIALEQERAEVVIPFPSPSPDDDAIPLVTGIPLIDADPKVIARRLANNTWEARARFFSNIITESIGNATRIAELHESPEGWREAMACALCGIHEKWPKH